MRTHEWVRLIGHSPFIEGIFPSKEFEMKARNASNARHVMYFYVVSTIGVIQSWHRDLANAKKAQARLGKASYWVIALDHKADKGRLVVVGKAGVATVVCPEGLTQEQGEWLWDNADKQGGLLRSPTPERDRALAALAGHEVAVAVQMRAIYGLVGEWL